MSTNHMLLPDLPFWMELGVPLIPLKAATKAPIPAEWQNRSHEDNNPDEFKSGENVGVVLGQDGLVDIDLDNPIALEIADNFLPPTSLEFGRPSTPRAHRFYLVEHVGPTQQFKTKQSPKHVRSDKSMLVEYRASGAQTMVPPSQHECGEQVRFDKKGDPSFVDGAALLKACALLAVATETIPHYVPGRRQNIALHLSGLMAKAGVQEDDARAVLEAITNHTGDEESEKRIAALEQTFSNHGQGKRISTPASLVSQLGTEAVASIQAHLERVWKGRLQRTRQASRRAYEITDSAVAEAYASASPHVLYVAPDKHYHLYRDGVWAPDVNNVFIAKEFDDFIRSQMEAVEERASWTRYRNRNNATAALLQARPLKAVEASIFDLYPDLLCLENVVINLRTGDCLPHSPELYLRHKLPLKYEPEATCPRFHQFLDETFRDQELIDYVTGLLGYFFTPNTDRQEFYIFHGEGANGKSVLADTITRMLGGFAETLMASTIFSGKNEDSDVATTEGCRWVTVPEAESDRRLNAALIKKITGEDVVKGKSLFANPKQFRSKAKYVMMCNNLPDLNALDQGLRRRVKCIPFDYVVPLEMRDPKLKATLWEERSGILNLALAGAQRYFQGKIVEPQKVKEATEAYFSEKDPIKDFLDEKTVPIKANKTTKTALYEAYRDFSSGQGKPILPKGQFGTALQKAMPDLLESKSGDIRFWVGIGLRDDREVRELEQSRERMQRLRQVA